ncbi:MAG TPA: two-component regulator propeller domain-containing protein [Kofleriaceae bacterium]
MRLFRAIAILWLAMASPARADEVAQDVPHGQTRFRVFAGDDGLRNLVIGGIAQDPSGFLWVATDDGVYRFDGEFFTHFSKEKDGLSSSLNFVVGIAPDGAPCVGSPAGLVCWDGSRFSTRGTRGLPKASIHAMVTFAGKLWVGTDGGGLYVQDGAGGFAPAPGWPGSPTAKIRGLWADANGLVVGDGATVELTAGNGVWQVLDVGVGNEQIEAVLRDRDGTLWIRTPLHMWMMPRGAAHAVDASAGLPTGYDMVDAAAAMAIGPHSEVMVGTDGGLAYREGDRWHLIDRSAGMPAAATRTLFVDREGTIWIGAAGLLQLRGRQLIEHYGAASGLPGDSVWSFRRDSRGVLWVGTNRCLARAVAGRWECLPGSEGRTVRSMVFPPQGGVFIGGAPSDLLYIDASGVPESLGRGDRPANSHILALTLGPEGDLWIATRAGLFRLRGATPGPLERVIVPGVRRDFRAVSLAVVGNQLWVGSEEGIVVLDRGTWHLLDERSGLRVTPTSYLAPLADGRMCVAYREAIGVSCFRYDNGTASEFEHIGPGRGLTTGMVYLLGEDREHRLWIGTGDGVDVVTPSGIDHFDSSDGIAGNDSTANAFLLDGDGSVWLGANGGATHVLAQSYRGPPRAPHTALLDVRLGGQPIGDLRGALEVDRDRNALTLELAPSTLLHPKRLEYQIRLSPIEQQWTTIHQRQVRYPGLVPNAYRFEVRSRIGAGYWGPTAELEFTVLPSWWQSRWFLILITALGLGAIAGVFTWRQRTVLRRRTRQLHDQTDASFRAVVDLMPDLIAVHRDRKLIYLNKANRRFLGIEDSGEHEGLQLIDRVHPDDRAQVAELFRRVQADPDAGSEVIEMRMRGPDGSWRACEISAIRVDLGGAPTVVASSRDVTERKRMRAKLIVSDRMASLGTLAAGIAHEINNPLAYVAGNLEAAAETLQATQYEPSKAECIELSAAIDDARDGAERVRKIVQGLRSFSRSEDDKGTPLALADVLEAAIRLAGNEVRHRAQLVREFGPVPLVVADSGRLTQVFINLLVNAAHAIPEGRSDENRITVRTRTDEVGRAVIEVADTGKGMPPEVQARVFDPFFTTKDVGEGTGLGLSICHGIVSSLGGQISIDSTLEQGTVVRVVLPPKVHDAVVAAAAPESQPVSRGNGKRHRVMLIDDEPQVARGMQRLLRGDHDVTVSLCARDALALIVQGARYDAIVTDVMMPNMTGIELIEELQRIAPDQARRVILLSGGVFTSQTRERLEQLGAPQLEKPVTAQALRDRVLQVVTDAKL